MAIVGLSEFTFGYGFLFEQTTQNWHNLRVAPILPSLRQEASEAWDARLPLLGTDFYYQFKLSDYLERRNSKFRRDGTYQGPYYRIAFHRRDNNRQHHRLWQHAVANPNTFYVAPEFNTIDEFNEAFLGKRLAHHSRIIPLRDCDDCTDGDQHYITFPPGDPRWTQHSKKKLKTVSYKGGDLERLYRESSPRWQPIDDEFAQATLSRTTGAIKRVLAEEGMLFSAEFDTVMPLLDARSVEPQREAILQRTAQILSAFVGVTMVVVGGDQ